jgi:magnesium-transporting ATPase (P-type)
MKGVIVWTYDNDCTEPVQLAKLRKEAEEAWDAMSASDYRLWVYEYAESGNLISENANTSEEKEEMFIQEYVEVNWVKE